MNPQIIRFAIEAHNNVNHLYNGAPYSVHLSMVVSYAYKYIHLIPDVGHIQQDVVDACWLHDTIEDCRLTYNDIKNVGGQNVADMVYAVTNEKGRNRKERANDNYYQGIINTPFAKFVKLCDRLANVKYSQTTNSQMYQAYQKEHSHFIGKLSSNKNTLNVYNTMETELKSILNQNKS